MSDRYTFAARARERRLVIDHQALFDKVMASCREGQRLILTVEVRDGIHQEFTATGREAESRPAAVSESLSAGR